MKKMKKLLVVCMLVAVFTLAFGTWVLATNTTDIKARENIVTSLNQAREAKIQADIESQQYKNALKSMQQNYWIAFLVILSLTFMGVMMTIFFIQSRKKLVTVKAENIQE